MEIAEAKRLASVGRVVAGVAHEIRNPIAAMRLKAENAIAAGPDVSRKDRALQEISSKSSGSKPYCGTF
jgi:C4-dicarboxylate-specific signal transduction histidine kinase